MRSTSDASAMERKAVVREVKVASETMKCGRRDLADPVASRLLMESKERREAPESE